MATALQLQPFEVTLRAELRIVTAVGKTKRDSHWLDCTASAKEEARILFEIMIRKRETVESIRELIAIPPETEEALTLYARKYPDVAGLGRVARTAEEWTVIGQLWVSKLQTDMEGNHPWRAIATQSHSQQTTRWGGCVSERSESRLSGRFPRNAR
jgi:hypothetical protein